MKIKPLIFTLLFASPIMAQQKIDYSKDIEFDKKTSIVSIPFEISMDDIQRQVNKSMPDLIYEDKSFEDNNHDDLKVSVWRKGNLIFTNIKNDIFTYEVPLKVWVQKRIAAFGMEQTPSTQFELKMKFSSKFSIDQNYTVTTLTNPEGFEWISKPVIKTAIGEIPIAPIVSKIIENKQAGFAAQIDAAIGSNLSLKPYVLDAWNTSLKPYKISEEYNTWLKITPIETYIVPFKTSINSLKSTVGFKVYLETLVGTPTETVSPVTQIPNLKIVNAIPDNFEVQLFNVVSYSEASIIAKRMFIGQKYDFKNGKYKIEITNIEVSKEDEKLVLTTSTIGNFKGTIIVKGNPVYNSEKKEIVLTNVELDLKTSNILHKSAAWLLGGILEKKIENDFGMPVTEIIDAAKKSTVEAINKEFSKGIKMRGNVISIEPKGVKMTESGILAIVNAKAKVELIVKGI